MSLKQVVKGTLPSAALNAIKRGTGVRRAGARFGFAEILSVRHARWVDESKVASFPGGSARTDAVVVDVGAHDGRWAEAALHVFRPARLIAVEPTPSTFERLSHRLGEESCAELHCCAVSNEPGWAALHQSTRTDFNSLLPLRPVTQRQYPGLQETGTVTVPVTTLDGLLSDAEAVQVLKIDVQGAESAVLRGARRVLARTEVVILETNFTSHYDGDVLFCDLNGQMGENGFDLYTFATQYHDREGRLLWADAVYARRDIPKGR